MDDDLTNISNTVLSGVIFENLWNSLQVGRAELLFYAKNEAGNIGQNSVLITKNTSETQGSLPPVIPGYDMLFLIGVISVTSVALIRKCLKS